MGISEGWQVDGVWLCMAGELVDSCKIFTIIPIGTQR